MIQFPLRPLRYFQNPFRVFKQFGFLGINRRNACYTLARNARQLYPLVDDKLQTKKILDAHQIPSPELYFTIKHNFELKYLRELGFLKDFVVKPARGAEGRGILVITDKTESGWKKASGEVISLEDIEYHVSNILAGLYALGGVNDAAFIEYRVRSHAVFEPLAWHGVPDIRLVLYRGVPVMSMLRLPTRESGGRANLHQGAVGAGVDMREGRTLGGVHHDRLIERHPDSGALIAGLEIPFWNDILEIAAKAYEVFGLGYLGIDFVIDHILGPLILELNARPGLSIQLANRAGLLKRLRAVDQVGHAEQLSSQERLSFAQNF
ncbi:MAG: alpha-L-glutamate ligase-like protein [Candidatus Omnitrophica bacterium]|nr:alpha-L-glutamate ligase-like protein [Candidatus Omnitrophota bacterium]